MGLGGQRYRSNSRRQLRARGTRPRPKATLVTIPNATAAKQSGSREDPALRRVSARRRLPAARFLSRINSRQVGRNASCAPSRESRRTLLSGHAAGERARRLSFV